MEILRLLCTRRRVESRRLHHFQLRDWRRLCRLTIQKLTLPDLEVNEGPQTFVVVFGAAVMAADEVSYEINVEESAAQRPLTQNIFIDHRTVSVSKPRGNGNRETHLRARKDCG